MYGDFSRDTFDRQRSYARVLMQQGRALIDADWNEQAAIVLHHLRTTSRDVIGPHGGPAGACAFELVTKDLAAKLSDADWVAFEPDETRRDALRKAVDGGDLAFGRGRYYVDGILIELDRPILYSEQPGYPFEDEATLEVIAGQAFTLYLEVWETAVNHLQDARLREAALGGADTCVRARIVWQVRAWMPDGIRLPPFDDAPPPPALRARARRDIATDSPCSVAPEARYRGVENHLYRVEVHAVGKDGVTFKWSRDNGSVAFPLLALAGGTALLGDVGRDDATCLAPNAWVEITDDRHLLGGRPGPLALIVDVGRDAMEAALAWPDGAVAADYDADEASLRHSILRRWDHAGRRDGDGALAVIEDTTSPEHGWIPLENGIEVKFDSGSDWARYTVGDYWLFPARVATGDVDWPRAAAGPLPRPPDGPQRRFAAIWDFDPALNPAITDHRCEFPSLCSLP